MSVADLFQVLEQATTAPFTGSAFDFVTLPIQRGFELVGLLLELIEDDGHIDGGFARYVASPHESPVPTGDVDVFCTSKDGYQRLIRRLSDDFEVRYSGRMCVTFRFNAGNIRHLRVIKPVNPASSNRVLYGSQQDVLRGAGDGA